MRVSVVQFHPFPQMSKIYNKSYFKTIDTIEKAYWLGFLYADGSISKKGYRCSLELSKKDACLVEKFCDALNVDRSEIKDRTIFNKKTNKTYYSTKVYLFSKELVDDLISHGCVNKKSLVIRLPELIDRKLNLSFLMGFYDGDGTRETTNICSGSKAFLYDVKNKYNIPFDVLKKKTCYTLTLGGYLKNEMKETYPDSLERKKDNYDTTRIINRNRPKKVFKLFITKEELEILIETKTYVEIGSILGVSDNAIKKRAKKLGIILKPRKNMLVLKTGELITH